MNTLLTTRSFLFSASVAALLWLLTGCQKDDPNNDCYSNGGIGPVTGRTVMFWTSRNFGCGPLHLVSIRNTQTNSTTYQGPSNANITQFFSTQPTCGTTGAITIALTKGYEYEYTIACTGLQWKGKMKVECSSDDCIAFELR